MECAPGEEMQVGFGRAAWIEAEGKHGLLYRYGANGLRRI